MRYRRPGVIRKLVVASEASRSEQLSKIEALEIHERWLFDENCLHEHQLVTTRV